MSIEAVQTVVDNLVEDEAFRERFLADRPTVLSEFELTGVEEDALLELDVEALVKVANTFNPRGRGLSIGSFYITT